MCHISPLETSCPLTNISNPKCEQTTRWHQLDIFRFGFGEAAGTITPKHRTAEGIRAWRWREPPLSFTGYCTSLFKYFSSSKTETCRALCSKTRAPVNLTLICSSEAQTKRQITLLSHILNYGWNAALMWTEQALIYQLCISFPSQAI